MARKKEIKEIIKDILPKAEVKEEKKPNIAEFNEVEARANALNTDKSHKDVLIKNIKELELHIKDMKAEIHRLQIEMENKQKSLKYVDDEIKAQSYNLSRQQEKFEKDNSEKLRILAQKQKDVEAADAEYKKLLNEALENGQKLKNELSKIYDERRSHQTEIDRLNRHVQDVESEANRKEADILEREKALKETLLAYETEKEALQPELSRISEIKNENTLLYQKIEDEKASFERQKNAFDSYREKLEADAEAERANIKRQQAQYAAQDAKYRQWEQDLKDIELELKARESEAQKMMKRYQLNQIAKEA